MKKYSNIFLIGLLAFTLGMPIVRAENPLPEGTDSNTPIVTNEDATPGDIMQNAQEEIKVTRAEVEAQIEKIRDDAKQKISDLKINATKLKNKAKGVLAQARILGRENALERFDQAIEKVSGLKDKVNTQIEKMSAQKEGLDMKPAQDLIATADAKIIEAKSKVAEASKILSASSNDLTKDQKAELKILTKDAQAAISDAHKALMDAVQYLKSLNVVVNTPETPNQ